MLSDEHFMKQALVLARQAYDAGEVPVGAVVVLGNYDVPRFGSLFAIPVPAVARNDPGLVRL